MKAYLKRIRENTSVKNIIIWWVFRIAMISAFTATFFEEEFDVTRPLAMIANLACMFIWEILMLFPEKSIFRHIPSGLQNILCLGIFASAFCGNYLNLYYEIRLWDSALHFIGGAMGVVFGYELVVAMMKRDKWAASLSLVLLASVGFSFFAGTAWELFEFAMDQVIGTLSGTPTDAQHWSLAMAEGTPKALTLFNPIVPDRWPLMDTMGDMVLNTVGAFAAYAVLKIYPYRHKGSLKAELDFSDTPKTAAV